MCAGHADYIKVNTDAAFFEFFNCQSFSMVARNHNGELVDAVSECKQGNIAPEMAKVIEIRKALSWE